MAWLLVVAVPALPLLLGALYGVEDAMARGLGRLLQRRARVHGRSSR